jgi:hypothetical protein
MGAAAKLLTGLQPPPPQLGRPGRLGRGDDLAVATRRAFPEDFRLGRAGDPDSRLVGNVDQPRDRNAEGVGDPGKGGQVGV